jgi:hypothetical protein
MTPRVVRSAPWYRCPLALNKSCPRTVKCPHRRPHHRRNTCGISSFRGGNDGGSCVRC